MYFLLLLQRKRETLAKYSLPGYTMITMCTVVQTVQHTAANLSETKLPNHLIDLLLSCHVQEYGKFLLLLLKEQNFQCWQDLLLTDQCAFN